MKKFLYVVGFIIVVYSICACETGAITLAQNIKMALVGVPLMFIGVM
jgi:uncharacterized membrane protein YhdT